MPRPKGGDQHGCPHRWRAPRHGPGPSWSGPARTPDRPPRTGPRRAPAGRTIRSWPLLVLAAPAAAEVWSGWVGIAQKTGFGLVSPLPGIWPSLHLDTTITLPVGVEAYAAYALHAWLAREHSISGRTRRFAKWSAICSFALGMAGQVAYHLLAQAGAARAPWPITTIVSCLPVLVLGMGTALAHMLRADADTERTDRTQGPEDQPRPFLGLVPGPVRRGPGRTEPGPRQGRQVRLPGERQTIPATGTRRGRADHRTGTPGCMASDGSGAPDCPQACRSRKAEITPSPARRGVRGSNAALNALARTINTELAATTPPGQP